MTEPSRRTAARRRRTVPRILHLVLMALLAPIVAAGAQTIAATGAAAVTAQAGTLAPAPLVAPRGFETALATLLVEIDQANRQAAEMAQQEKAVVAEAERITKESAAIRDSKAALNARVAAVNQEISGHNERAKALDGEIAAHNAKPHTFQMPAEASAAAAFDAEARRLEAQKNQENAVEDKIQGEESQIRQEASQVDARSSQLDAASKANDTKSSDLKTKAQQLQARSQQLLGQMAQVIQSFASVPPNPAAAMDQGGDAPAPAPQAGNRSVGQEEDTGDSPYRRPRAAALTQYARQQHGTTVDTRPGTAYLTPDAVRRLSAAQAATLGSPSMSYDGLVRKPNGHYTALRVQAPATTTAAPAPAPAPAVFESGGLVVHRNGEQLPVDEVTTVQEAPVATAPGPANPAPGGNGNRSVSTCKDLKRSGATDLDSGGWVDYLPSDAQGRNRGVKACLEGKPSSKRGQSATSAGNIRGWIDAQARVVALGFSPTADLARCHSVPRMAGGTADERNLTPCFQRGANTNQATGGTITNSMRTFETRAESGMNRGYVLYNVRPQYNRTSSTIPSKWEMSLYAWDATTGSTTDSAWTVVDNASYGPTGLVNLGN
ncbi:DNA/RNA non-specific endonuclease [Streptomyces sp. TLI_235]|nr:DNA/RNA non-specific endonuclease [Streptomyces sp. TLI_235]PBC66150.1 DNA/RNA non-specific endonuclease [Streptomyces sp. TLI_235]